MVTKRGSVAAAIADDSYTLLVATRRFLVIGPVRFGQAAAGGVIGGGTDRDIRASCTSG